MMRLLAGHVGHVQTTLSLLQGESDTSLAVAQQQQFDNAAFSSLVALVAEFLHGARVDAAALSVPRLEASDASVATSPPWPLRGANLGALLGTARVELVQEAQAALLGIPEVARENLVWLQPGSPAPGHIAALVNVGQGYGRALSATHVQPTLTEQTPFAPRNAIERRLLNYLAERKDAVHLEHVLSAPGLGRLYEFLLHEGLAAPTALAEVQRAEDPNAEIARLGRRDLDLGCAAAVAFFVDLLGAELSHLALQLLPRAGLYVTGDLVRTLRSALEAGELLEAFRDREHLGRVLESIPLALVDEPALPLLGAKRAAFAAAKGA